MVLCMTLNMNHWASSPNPLPSPRVLFRPTLPSVGSQDYETEKGSDCVTLPLPLGRLGCAARSSHSLWGPAFHEEMKTQRPFAGSTQPVFNKVITNMYKASPRYEIPLTKEQTNQQGQNPERNVPKRIASPAEPEASPRFQTPHSHPHHTHRLRGLIVQRTLGGTWGSGGGGGRKEVRKASHVLGSKSNRSCLQK